MSANPYPCRYIGRPDVGRYERPELRSSLPEVRPPGAEEILRWLGSFRRMGDEYFGITTGERS